MKGGEKLPHAPARAYILKGGHAMITFEYRFDVLPGKAKAKFHGLVTHVTDSLLLPVSDKKK